MKHKSIIFMQGDDAIEPLDILENHENPADIWDYLRQWDDGDGEESDKPFYGSSDYIIKRDDGLVISYNLSLGYIALSKIIKEENQNGLTTN
jgi:hypothetical protein